MKKIPKNEWPLGELISTESLVSLMKYQWETYGTKLDIVIEQRNPVEVETEIEPVEEIDKLIRERPRYFGDSYFVD